VEWHLFQQSVEIRYQSFLPWDRPGKVASDLVSRFPSLTVDEAGPGEIILVENEDQIKLAYGFKLSRITAVPRTLKSDRLEHYAPEFFSVVLRDLEIKTLSRVGHRMIHHLKFPSIKDAETKLNSFAKKYHAGADLLQETKDPLLAAKTLRRVTLRFEDDKTGLTLSLRPNSAKVSITGPNSDAIRVHVPPEEFSLVLDVDVYTTQPLPSSDFVVSEFIKSNLKMLRTRLMPLVEA
jgi:hypothetical protein